jgi:hypothetical protein
MNDTSGSIKGGHFLTAGVTIGLSGRTLLYAVSLLFDILRTEVQ